MEENCLTLRNLPRLKVNGQRITFLKQIFYICLEFLSLLQHKPYTDLKVTLILNCLLLFVCFEQVGSKLIPCHKLVLACVIPYFKAMFLSEMAEAKQTLIEIRDFDGDAIEDLVKFVYSSRLTLTIDNVQPLLYAACILQVELVAKACCEYMKLHFHPSNCLAVRAFAESHNRIDLMDMADQYACEHFTEVVECEDFVSVSPQHLHKLLSSSDLNIENEKQVYSAAIKWLLANPQHHSKWLDETLAQVGAEIDGMK